LGTPPINVFGGRVEHEKLYIGQQAIMKTPGVADQSVSIGIRPEGFILAENGVFTCDLNRVEVMGRDVSIVCGHEECENTSVRAIISADNSVDTTKKTVSFNLKEQKVFIFNAETQLRIPIREA
jgi:multiple sugar transport system ATP-binding protein